MRKMGSTSSLKCYGEKQTRAQSNGWLRLGHSRTNALLGGSQNLVSLSWMFYAGMNSVFNFIEFHLEAWV